MNDGQAMIAALSLVVVVLSAVIGVVWRLSNTLKDLSVAISALRTEIVENTMNERERTDKKIREAVASCRVVHAAQAHSQPQN